MRDIDLRKNYRDIDCLNTCRGAKEEHVLNLSSDGAKNSSIWLETNDKCCKDLSSNPITCGIPGCVKRSARLMRKFSSREELLALFQALSIGNSKLVDVKKGRAQSEVSEAQFLRKGLPPLEDSTCHQAQKALEGVQVCPCASLCHIGFLLGDYHHMMARHTHFVQENLTCTYFTIELEKNEWTWKTAFNKLTAKAAVALYNHYQLKAKGLRNSGKTWIYEHLPSLDIST